MWADHYFEKTASNDGLTAEGDRGAPRVPHIHSQGVDLLARILCSAVIGIDAYIVEVEVDIAAGLPAFTTAASGRR